MAYNTDRLKNIFKPIEKLTFNISEKEKENLVFSPRLITTRIEE